MKYLSLVTVDKRAFARRDGYAWHKAIWEAFPGRPEDKRDFLFRVDDQRDEFRIHVLSPDQPTPPAWGKWRTREIAGTFLEHDRYRFQLKANPTLRRNADRRRIGLLREENLRDWMARKAAVGGFGVEEDSLVMGAPMEERFFRGQTMGKHVAVDFRGVLRVQDREKFKRTFAAGIGSAKGFGFGLLMLEPVE
jgi:CRISPR system Cascade subunit CasE